MNFDTLLFYFASPNLYPIADFTSLHDPLYELVKEAGYGEYDGVCYGFTFMAMQACLTGQKEPFLTRLRRIHLIHNYAEEHDLNIKDVLSALKHITTHPHTAHTDLAKAILSFEVDTHAFLDNTILIQNPTDHTHIISTKRTPINQNYNAIKALVASKLIEDRHLEITCTDSATGIFDPDELHTILKDLTTRYAERNFCLVLTNPSHIFPIFHEAGGKTYFLEPNALNFMPFYSFETDKLTHAILREHGHPHTGHVGAMLMLYALSHEAPSLQFSDTTKALYLGHTKRRDQAGDHLLHHLCYSKIEITPLLSTFDPSLLNHPDANGFTPLHTAVVHYDLEKVKALLNRGAHPHLNDFDNLTPMDYAIVFDTPEALRLLLKAGACPNHFYKGKSALQRAIDLDHDQCMLALIEHGAYLGPYPNGRNALTQAIRKQSLACIKAFCALPIALEPFFDLSSEEGYSLLHNAVQTLPMAIFELLIEATVNLDRQNPKGHTPLMQAFQFKEYDKAQRLLEKGANPNAVCHQNIDVLSYALQSGDRALITLAARYGARPNFNHWGARWFAIFIDPDLYPQIPLFFSLYPDLRSAIQACDKSGMSPLRCVLEKKAYHVASALLAQQTMAFASPLFFRPLSAHPASSSSIEDDACPSARSSEGFTR